VAAQDRSIAAGLALVMLYVAVRTIGAPEPVVLGWAALAALAAIVSPLTGLLVLAAIGPFTEAQTADGRITPAPILAAATAAGAGVRFLLSLHFRATPVPVALALLLAVGTLIGVGVSAVSFGSTAGVDALQRWVAGIGAGLGVLLAGWWVGRSGEVRPLAVAAVSIAVAAVIAMAQYLAPATVAASPLAWLTRPLADPARLSGIIPGPNSAATIFLVGLALLGSAAVMIRRPRVRAAALIAAVPLLTALAFTFSRSALLALLVMLLIGVWHFRHRSRLVLAGLLVVAALVVAGGMIALSEGLGSLPGRSGGDQLRAGAWGITLQMWLDSPIWGQGFRSFEWLHSEYATRLDAPHNEWLRFFAEEGVAVGLVALAFAATTLLSLLRAPGWAALAGAGAAGALFVMATFNNPLLYIQVNVPAFLVIGIGLGWAHRSSPEGPVDPAANDRA
jgi:O-antigen ligase